MSPARRIALATARNSFRLLLLAVFTVYAVIATFSAPDVLRSSLEEAKAYDRFVPTLLETNAKQDPKGIFVDPAVRELTAQAFSPSYLREQSDVFTDASYAWLRGEQNELRFRISMESQREQLAEALSIYQIERLSGLPTCTAFETELQLDPFKATCQPAGINYKTEQASLQKALLDSNDFLGKTVYTQDDLPKSKSGESFAQAAYAAPLLYAALKPLLYLLTVLLLILSFMLVMMRPVRRNGWKDLGKALLYSSVVLAISAAIFGIFLPRITRQYQSQLLGGGAEEVMTDVVVRVSVHFQTAFINAAILGALVGAVILVYVKLAPKGSRYKRLEHVTGIVNAVSPARLTKAADARARNAPIVTSERTKKRAIIAKKHKKNARIKREIT